jgi:hypothetical protein
MQKANQKDMLQVALRVHGIDESGGNGKGANRGGNGSNSGRGSIVDPKTLKKSMAKPIMAMKY